MANTHAQFNKFNLALSVSGEKDSLKTARREIRRRLKSYFSKHHDMQITVKGAGSYALGTIIQKKDGRIDLDDVIALIYFCLVAKSCNGRLPIKVKFII
ncbi:MAG: hypothetical protein WBH03_15260, partial [Cyclobacteriaceae bacterium]